MKKVLFILCILIFNTNTSIVISSENLMEDETLFFMPIKFTTTGLTCFFNHRYNNPKYIEDFFPNNLEDIIHFLGYARSSNQNRTFIQTIFKIFMKKVKCSNYISVKELITLSQKLPEFLDIYLLPEAQPISDEYAIKNILCTEFAENFGEFKDDPNKFLSKLSQKICAVLVHKEKPKEHEITSSELREILVRFLENAYNKCLFDITDEQDIWQQYKDLSHAAYNLQSLIHDTDNINDLISSVLARFYYTIDMVGSDISADTYRKAIDELEIKRFDWLELEEHDTLMKPKKDELLYVLKNMGMSKALARTQFGFTDATT